MMSDAGRFKPPGKFIQSVSLAVVVLKHRKWRRNLIFGLTLLTLFLVFGGGVILGDRLMDHPVAFVLFWLICFLLVGLVLMLAILDMMIIRRDHRKKIRELEGQLAGAAAEARELAAAEAENAEASKKSGGPSPPDAAGDAD